MKRILLTAVAALVLAAPAMADEPWWINERPDLTVRIPHAETPAKPWWINERPDLAQRIPLAETPLPPSRLPSEIPVASAN
jgi:hypothetical protein